MPETLDFFLKSKVANALSRPANNNCFSFFLIFLLLDEILKRRKANLEEFDEGNEKAPEKDGLESKVNEGSECDNPASSVPDLSSPQSESEDGNSASDKLVADGKAGVLCFCQCFSTEHSWCWTSSVA